MQSQSLIKYSNVTSVNRPVKVPLRNCTIPQQLGEVRRLRYRATFSCVYDHFTGIVRETSPRPRNKLAPRYLRGKCFVVRVQRGVVKFAPGPGTAGRKDKSVFEFRWITSEQGIS